ncbi:hypothetical protein [Parasedimentitalea psychrophila]|uniref:Helicase/UvrB N-terminal domain-containing protein n=1 Tax=Parasedimentitalea psychrophila TaxID=2997337 RepID=A0A9Y2P658_9RHOB|nr:hypothetical protein [Parasedimentitalea psychrophila]WIY24330.1 hypothetical protein QPJ95_17265 [Parasedimentitalea psychrophila]
MKIDLEELDNTTIEQRCQTVYWQNLWPTEADEQPPAPALQIKATTGLGKTTLAIEEIAKDPVFQGSEVHFYAPDNTQAAEVAQFARQSGLRAKIVRGRTSSKNSTGYCARYKVTEAAAKAGLNVYKTCCKHSGKICPHFKTCPYLKQWDDPDPAFRIFNHQYVFLPKPSRDGIGLPHPELAIVDESLVSKCTAEHSFGVDRLQGPFLEAVEDDLHGRKELSAGLAARNVDARWAWDKAEAISPDGTTGITPETSDKVALKALKEIDLNEAVAQTAFFRAIAREIEFARPIYGITLVKDELVRVNGKTEHQNRVHVHTKRDCQIPRSTPLMLLDADANLTLNEKIFDRPITPVEIHAKQSAKTLQVFSTRLSNRTLLGPDPKKHPQITVSLSKVEAIIKRETKRTGKVLVVMPKQVETVLKAKGKFQECDKTLYWHGAEVAHFGAIRGQDCWKHFGTIVIVGRNEPPGSAIDHVLRSLFSDEPSPLVFAETSPLPQECRGYRLEGMAKAGVLASVHPDPKGQLILEQIRECETTQATGRLRLVHSQNPKRVVILCSLPVDITVDELRTLDDFAQTPGRRGATARIREAVGRKGILPLGTRDLTQAFPDLFPSKSVAKDALKELRRWVLHAPSDKPCTDSGTAAKQKGSGTHMSLNGPQPLPQTGCGEGNARAPPIVANASGLNGGEHQIEYLFGITPHYRIATYRRVGQRGKSSRAIIDLSRHADPKAALENLLGEKLTQL